MPRGSVWAVGLSACVLVAGCLHAPVLWSPDGHWIAYTIAVRPEPRIPPPGWIFETLAPQRLNPSVRDDSSRAGPPRLYRLWATRVDTGASVLLEESPGPLTSPCWSPDGKALAFGRLVPEANGRTRYEVVIQEGPDRQRVVLSRLVDDFSDKATDLPGLALTWSPDGRFLTVPLLQRTLDLGIVQAENGRIVKIIEGAHLPSWSPDSSKLAFMLGGDVETLYVIDKHFGPPRQLVRIGQATQAPVWLRDSQAVLVVTHLARRGENPSTYAADLVRVKVETAEAVKLATLFEPQKRLRGHDAPFLGVSFATDRDGETVFVASDVEGEPHAIKWLLPRNKETLKVDHPIDPAIRLGGLAVSPSDSQLAVRIGSPGYLSPPGLIDLTSDRNTFTPLVPDDAARVEWLMTLIDAARGLLRTGLPPIVVDSRAVQRPSLLPIPGELDEPARQQVLVRLRKLGRVGRPLCDRPADGPSADPGLSAFLDEARLFFDYLRLDYAAAEASLERMEQRTSNPNLRLRLLSVRAQILLGQREFGAAAETIDFLGSVQPRTAHRIEQTPAGPVLTPEIDGRRGWPSYLGGQAEKLRGKPPEKENPFDGLNDFGNQNPDAPQFDLPAPGAPFAPVQFEALPELRLEPADRAFPP